MKECWLDLYRTLNHEKMFERKSWERTGLLKPKTPQIKELVPEEKEAWWSKRETKYQLSLLSKCTPSLSSNVLSRKATERMTLFFHRTTPTKGAIMHGNFSDKLSSTCHALYTVCAERITHERSPHFCWSLAPLFPLFWFFFFYTQRRTSFQKFLKGAFYAQSNCRITRPRQKALEKWGLTQCIFPRSTRCKLSDRIICSLALFTKINLLVKEGKPDKF